MSWRCRDGICKVDPSSDAWPDHAYPDRASGSCDVHGLTLWKRWQDTEDIGMASDLCRHTHAYAHVTSQQPQYACYIITSLQLSFKRNRSAGSLVSLSPRSTSFQTRTYLLQNNVNCCCNSPATKIWITLMNYSTAYSFHTAVSMWIK